MDRCAVAYEQNICTDESELMLQWFNSQCLNQTMPMQPDLLPLHEDCSNNSFPNSEFYNTSTTDPCNLYGSNPINCSLFPPSNNIGYESLQQGMGLGCMCMPDDDDLHSMSYLDVDVNQLQCESQVVFTDENNNNNVLQLKEKRKLEINCSSEKEKETNDDDTECISNNVPRKKSRPSVRAPTRAKTSKEESSNGESSSCSSEDELNGESNANCNSNSKSKASRGSSTYSQSLYARKRREKINQRLRILQNLVPNGTKVDISTMLEEAVQYVKFMQMQIKLLSSDDLWMYAPLAYNGVNINIDLSRCQ